MYSLNRATIIGNLGRDPEIRTLDSGTKVANFSVATSESWKDKATGERKERTQWHNVVVFNDGLAGIIERNLSKGSKVFVAGAIENRKYTDKQGVERTTTEIVLRQYNGEIVILDGREGSGRPPPNDDAERSAGARPAGSQSYSDVKGRGTAPSSRPADLDDDIPF
jgi:single-strand DNA-binding protein